MIFFEFKEFKGVVGRIAYDDEFFPFFSIACREIRIFLKSFCEFCEFKKRNRFFREMDRSLMIDDFYFCEFRKNSNFFRFFTLRDCPSILEN